MKIKVIPSIWLPRTGWRLDTQPYMTGAFEIEELLKRHNPSPLQNLTKGHDGGIYNGPQFARNYVVDPDHGVPFLTTTTMLQADSASLPLLSKKDALSKKLRFLEVKEGMTLITCSGTIGRIAYARKDLDGVWSNQDILKVVPNPDEILSGYLYAFLISRYGLPFILAGKYGTLKHIEPHHIADLPVPRLGNVEERVHELIQQSSEKRTKAISILRVAGRRLNESYGFPDKLALSPRTFSCSITSSNSVFKRMEATYHDVIAQESDRLIRSLPRKDILIGLGVAIGEIYRLKQVFVDAEYGAPFLTSGEIFRLCYEPPRYLAKTLLPDESEWAVREGDLLLARSGQVGGIIGRGVWADKRFSGACVSVDVLRISAHNSQILSGYLYAYLFLTDVGYRQLVRTAAGSSIPHISANDVSRLLIPRGDDEFEEEINKMVWNAGNLRAEAQENEDEARNLVERAIEEGV